MDTDNPHGGGVAWEENGAIEFRRGLDAKQIYALQQEGTIKLPYLLHFRWATHGAKGPHMTHPFPTGIRAFMGELSGSTDSVIIHNGTWGGYSNVELPNEIPGAMMASLSDTAVAAFYVAQDPSVLERVYWSTAHAFIKEGKMDIKTRGTWNAFEGNQYSNLNWLPTSKSQKWDWKDSEYWWPRDGYDKSYTGTKSDGWKTEGSPYRVPADTSTKKEGTFEDYIRTKYGDDGIDIMNELMRAEGKPDEDSFAGVLEDLVLTTDTVSEEFSDVNNYLAKKYGEG